jgi:hypothetical protein
VICRHDSGSALSRFARPIVIHGVTSSSRIASSGVGHLRENLQK